MSDNVNNPCRRKIMRWALVTGASLVTRPAMAAQSGPEVNLDPEHIGHPALARKLAVLLENRLTPHLAGKLMTLPVASLEGALASKQDLLAPGIIEKLANEPMPQAIQSFNLLCEKDCLAGRTLLVDSWLTCQTEVTVALLHARLRSPGSKKRISYIDLAG